MSLGSGLVLALLLSAWPVTAHAQLPSPGPPTPDQTLLREIYKELVEINTTDSVGDTTAAARAMAARLKAGGFADADLQIIVPPGAPRKGNLVARLKGTGAKAPLLLLAHLDVVEAKREDWERDPFKLVEEDGYFYARGSVDDKAMAAIFVANLIRYKKAGYVPERDLILALTADEELGSNSRWNGVSWLLKHHRALIEAEFALNEGGGGEMTRQGRPILLRVQAAEKVTVSFRLETRNPGGHSSLPRRDNAIYQLAEGLARFSRHEFPAKLNEITRGYFQRSAPLYTGAVADDMRAIATDGAPDPQVAARLSAVHAFYNSIMRTTCVATRLEGGHADNALPQTARALVNCRVLPGEPVDGGAGGDREGPRRSRHHGDPDDHAGAEPAVAAAARSHAGRRGRDHRALAGHSGDSHHEHRRDRFALPPQRGHPRLRRVRPLPGPRRRALARAQRADAGAVAVRRPRVPVPPGPSPGRRALGGHSARATGATQSPGRN